MNIISLEQDNSSFINNTEKDKNFSALDYISISSYTLKNCEPNNCTSFLSFNLDLFNDPDIIIHSSKLLIPLEIFRMTQSFTTKEISLSFVTEEFSYEKLTWNNQPKATFFQSIPITQNEIKNSCIAIDITSLVCQWIYNGMNNYGLKLSVDSSNIMIILPKNKIKYSPKLVINYSRKDNSNSIPSALFIRSTNNKGLIINPNDTIIMDDIVTISPKGLSYNTETGIITITRKGYYNFYFVLNIMGTGTFPETQDQLLTVSLKNLSTNEILSFHTPEVIPARMPGHGIFLVKHQNEQFALINNSQKILQLADFPHQASLSISIIE